MKKTLYFAGAALLPLLTFLTQAQILEVTPNPRVKIAVAETSEAPQAVVISVNGKCTYSEDGVAFTPLRVGQICREGVTVRTGDDARADLFFRRIGTTVRLQESTEMKLEKLRREAKDGQASFTTLLDLRAGRIFTVVRALVPGSTLEIRNAAGRSVVEGGGGNGRYIITADGTHVAHKDSTIPLKLVGETGITVIEPGHEFKSKDGKTFSVNPASAVAEFILLDEIQSLAEELTPTVASKGEDRSQALVLAVGPHATVSRNGGAFEKLKVGQVLNQGAVVRSGDKTVIDLILRRWGTSIRLVPDTELAIEKLAKTGGTEALALETKVHLRAGRIFCFIRIPVANGKFEVKTARGASVIESAGAGRYDIRADGTIVSGKSSFKQVRVITENGVTLMAPGQTFSGKDGQTTPAAPSDSEILVIEMDQLAALAEELAEEPLPNKN